MIRKQPCCMCPARTVDFKEHVCDGTQVFMGENVPKCTFVVTFVDERGWEYFVRGGIGQKTFKAFYRKPGGSKEKGYSRVKWRESFSVAQIDLNAVALSKDWIIK